MDNRLFKVVHPDTLKEWTDSELEEYVKTDSSLNMGRLEGIFLDDVGEPWLVDNHGYFLWLPSEKFQLEWNFDDYHFAMVIHNGHAWRRVD